VSGVLDEGRQTPCHEGFTRASLLNPTVKGSSGHVLVDPVLISALGEVMRPLLQDDFFAATIATLAAGCATCQASLRFAVCWRCAVTERVRQDTAQVLATPAFVQAVNADAAVSLVVHVGDIHSGKSYCTTRATTRRSTTSGLRTRSLWFTPRATTSGRTARRRKEAVPTMRSAARSTTLSMASAIQSTMPTVIRWQS
jgi:hypothetical protein